MPDVFQLQRLGDDAVLVLPLRVWLAAGIDVEGEVEIYVSAEEGYVGEVIIRQHNSADHVPPLP